MREFDVLNKNEPLFQNTLIEASAGTGKTFSIENIVLRALTEISPQKNRFLTIEEILVVTFTVAATKDLLLRIRQNLEKALESNEDPITKKRLELALFSFDEVKIFTIHKFCAKELSDEGFLETSDEKNTLSNTALIQVIRDFFRTESQNFHEAEFELLLKAYPYEELEKELLKRVLQGKRVVSLGSFEVRKKLFESLNFDTTDFIEKIQKIAPYFLGVCNKNKEIKSLNEIEAFISSQETFVFCLKNQLKWLDLFREENRSKKPLDEKELPFINTLNRFREQITPLISPLTIFANVLNGVLDLLERKLEKENSFRFDDLLKGMWEKCQNRFFLEKIREKYKMAIVDEFQDTDSLQWKIFKTLFLDSKEHCLYLVGDPKQAIYAFRGADVYTYIEASKLIENRACLKTNYRSDKQLIDALNTLFEGKYLIDLPKSGEKILYTPVKASSKETPYKLTAVEVITPKENLSSLEEAERDYFFPYLVKELISLKELGVPFDRCALLVADRFQAQRCAAFLKKAQIKSVQKKQPPIEESKSYEAVLDLLSAMNEIEDENLLKKVLGGPFFCLTDLDLKEEGGEGYEKLFFLRKTLFEKGCFPFFDTLFDLTKIALLKKEGGNEFLKEVEQFEGFLSKQYGASPQELLKIFKELPLNSFEQEAPVSEDAVIISTIHSSKGLEYDVVFSLGTLKKIKGEETFIPKKNDTRLTPKFDQESFELFVKEIKAEQLRLLYVAWTRAKFKLYIPYLPSKSSKEFSSMDLFCEGSDFLTVCKKTPSIAISILEKEEPLIYQELKKPPLLLKPLEKPLIPLEKPIVSFTSLSKEQEFEKETTSPPKDFEASIKNRHTLPGGVETGLLLHHILETIPLTTDKALLRGHIRLKTANTPFASWVSVIEEMLIPLWTEPFIGSCVLGNLKGCFREMSFLNSQRTQMVKGVIDLMFLFDNKIYLVDWKSHWLGEDDSHYQKTALEKAIKPYLLQKELYENALIPYLRLFPNLSFGGTFIYFLRGGKGECL